jgi:hypothetical protein
MSKPLWKQEAEAWLCRASDALDCQVELAFSSDVHEWYFYIDGHWAVGYEPPLRKPRTAAFYMVVA